MADRPTSSGSEATSAAFRNRAQHEAARYGPDPWVFVRELIQNSRDAGATRVEFLISEEDDRSVVACIDNGDGMSFDHARRYLFALYASSKTGRSNQAGKFGVGFWSVLRFEPSSITIRSHTRAGESWGVRLAGDLSNATQVQGPKTPGTQVVLERKGLDGRLEHRVFDAARQNARFIHHREHRETGIEVSVNGRSVTATFELPAPSAAFRRGSIRGVVGLGTAPRVEIFCRGLRIRATASLSDLLTATARDSVRSRVRFPELPQGLAPQALLESPELDVMLSRADARDTKVLRRMVALAQRELERLIERQLSASRPLPWWRAALQWLDRGLRHSIALQILFGTSVGVLISAVALLTLFSNEAPAGVSGHAPLVAPVAVLGVPNAVPAGYVDLGASYSGPTIDTLDATATTPIELTYDPPRPLLLSALTLVHARADGSLQHERVPEPRVAAPATECAESCVTITVPVAEGGTIVRLPVPTGHGIVGATARLDEHDLAVRLSRNGHPVIDVQGMSGTLVYRTSPAGAIDAPAPLEHSLPPDLVAEANAVTSLRPRDRVLRLIATVHARIRYDRTPTVADKHRAAASAGDGFLKRTLAIGAGDCDVQNSVLTQLLRAAGIPARLAIGYVGIEGRVMPWLHAWVEYRGADGSWHVADASESQAGRLVRRGTQATAATPAAAGQPPPTAVARVEPTALVRADREDSPAAPPTPPSAAIDEVGSTAAAVGKWGLGAPLVLLLASGLLFYVGRTKRNIRLNNDPDLSRLIRAALEQPGMFAHVPALYSRELVPCLRGRVASLQACRRLAGKRQLFCGSGEFGRNAARAGRTVVDVGTPEGRIVAQALAATDLDVWQTLLNEARAHPVADLATRFLRQAGRSWTIRVARGSHPFSVLELRAAGLRLAGDYGDRVIIVGERHVRHPETDDAASKGTQAQAAFDLLETMSRRLGLDQEARLSLLRYAARAGLKLSSSEVHHGA